MANTVVGIRFKAVGKKYYFDPQEFDLTMYDKVVVETVRGFEMGEVIEGIKEVDDKDLIAALKPVQRKATEQDIKNYEKNIADIPNALERCNVHIKKNKLEMKLLGCEYTLDRTKLIIYFNAEGRVDFRELVKDLANEFRLRIELRQVGTRDGAKFLGGIGPCGYLLCCNTFLGDFETVSIKMAKNQNLSLNPVNISGLCGKLLCCIKYENDTYTEHRRQLPKQGSMVLTKDDGKAKVIAVNVIDKSVRVQTQEDGIKSFKVDELKRIFDYDKKTPKKDGE
jgi:cell fate regulator YaaT (PSP1 superfamily)